LVQSLTNHYQVRGIATHMSGDQGLLLVELFSTVYLQKKSRLVKSFIRGEGEIQSGDLLRARSW
jgi:hypothetical protein